MPAVPSDSTPPTIRPSPASSPVPGFSPPITAKTAPAPATTQSGPKAAGQIEPKPVPRPAGAGLIDLDPWLEPYANRLVDRYQRYLRKHTELIEAGGSLLDIAGGFRYFGFNRGERGDASSHAHQKGVWYREWAPGAKSVSLIGDFNNWDRAANPLHRDHYGVWSCFLPDSLYHTSFTHNSKLKIHIVGADGSAMDRIPAYIKRVEFGPRGSNPVGIYWNPPPFAWRHARPAGDEPLRIYEAHAGMALEEPRVGTFDEFRRLVLPRIAAGGYNAVQLMAVAEHPYYGSFGYHVSNFFAVSSRFGTPTEFKQLVDDAHGLGLRVIMDLVHSHSVKNTLEGLNRFDGTDFQYFHAGPRGQHPAWDSLLFDYDKFEVLRFLLSNVRYWLEEYHLDGFRFDGVTSMMYLDHGHRQFTSYDDYLLPDNLDQPAITYLQLASEVAQSSYPGVTLIAEDVSGMVGMGRPVAEGGLGFEYRLAMGLPDMWIRLLRDRRDDDWSMREIFATLSNRRAHEKHIAYCESHDQALVGDKTLAFWLMDADMYWHMNKAGSSLVIDRGIALHKLIRLVTLAVGGEGWLNFMGNEFGHPEWIDFPREGNNWSHQHARRQWSLADHPDLRYRDLLAFDRAMLELEAAHHPLRDPWAHEHGLYDDRKLMFFTRGPLVFAFNFHPTQSYTDLRVPVPAAGTYRLALDTDQAPFGGFARVQSGQTFHAQNYAEGGLNFTIKTYLPSRTAQVFVRA